MSTGRVGGQGGWLPRVAHRCILYNWLFSPQCHHNSHNSWRHKIDFKLKKFHCKDLFKREHPQDLWLLKYLMRHCLCWQFLRCFSSAAAVNRKLRWGAVLIRPMYNARGAVVEICYSIISAPHLADVPPWSCAHSQRLIHRTPSKSTPTPHFPFLYSMRVEI